MPVMLMPLNKYRSTVCCSKCGERTTAPYVTDDKSYTAIGGESSHDCVSARPANSGESRGVGRGQWEQVGARGMVGDGDHAAVLAQSASVKKPQPRQSSILCSQNIP